MEGLCLCKPRSQGSPMVCIVHQIRDNMLSKGWKSQGGAFLAKIWVRKQFLESDKVNSFDMREKRLPRAWKGTLDRPVSRMLLLGFIQGRLKLIIFFLSFFFFFLSDVSQSQCGRKWRFSENDRQGWGKVRSPLRSTNWWVESTWVKIQLYHLKGIMWAERRGQKW